VAAEAVLAGAAARLGWAASHWLLALTGVAWLVLVAGVGTGLGHGLAVGDLSQVIPITAAALTRIPAAWVLVGLVVAVWGIRPHATALVWGAYAAFILVGEFGQLWGVPRWVMDVSPFAHSPCFPGCCRVDGNALVDAGCRCLPRGRVCRISPPRPCELGRRQRECPSVSKTTTRLRHDEGDPVSPLSEHRQSPRTCGR
jgi:hypothetical protein